MCPLPALWICITVYLASKNNKRKRKTKKQDKQLLISSLGVNDDFSPELLFYRVYISIGINDDFRKSYLLISCITFFCCLQSTKVKDKQLLFYRVHISIGINDDFLKSYLLISYIIFSSKIRDKYTPTFTLLYRKGENNSKSHKKNQKKKTTFPRIVKVA